MLPATAHAYQRGKDCPFYPLPPEPKEEAKPKTKPKPKPPDTSNVPLVPPNNNNNANSLVASEPQYATVSWTSINTDAPKSATENKGPYALFFCDAATSEVAGEGPSAWASFKKSGKAGVLRTVFDIPLVVAEFNAAGISQFSKVPLSEANKSLYQKYNTGAPAVIICAPDGRALRVFSGSNCSQTPIVSYLQKEFKSTPKQ
jgi:hypothetical protein